MSFHISQRFIDELLEEDCPYMDLTVEALGIGREPGLLTCHPKPPVSWRAWRSPRGFWSLRGAGLRAKPPAAIGWRRGRCFCAPKARRGPSTGASKSRRTSWNIHPASQPAQRACWKARARPIPMCSWPLPASISLGPNGFRLRRRKLVEPSRIGSGFRTPCWFLISIVSSRAGSTDSPPGCPSAERRFRNRSWARKSPPRRKPSCWHARASIPSNANVLPVRILKKRYAGVKAVNAAVQVLGPPEA